MGLTKWQGGGDWNERESMTHQSLVALTLSPKMIAVLTRIRQLILCFVIHYSELFLTQLLTLSVTRFLTF